LYLYANNYVLSWFSSVNTILTQGT
jgi:hypothetical protein